MSDFDILWIDGEREPQMPPNPKYPKGIDIDGRTSRTAKSCKVELPYPAKRCGRYDIYCRTCKYRVQVTTAGRIDDPRSVRLTCVFSPTEDASGRPVDGHHRRK